MEQQNYPGGRFTNDPHFGKQVPNTQYRGYEEEETFPYGNPSGTPAMSRPQNHHSYTSQYRGNNPEQQQGRHQGSQYQGMQGGTYQGSQYGGSQYQGMPGNNYQGGPYSGSQYQGAQGQGGQYGGAQYQDMQGTAYHGTLYGGQQNPGIPGAGYQGVQPQSFEQSTTAAGSQNQGQQKTPQYNDRDRVHDLLTSEKHLTEGYNSSTFEATNPQLHNTLKNILNETHNNRETLLQAMEQRGWHKTEQADQQQISQAHMQYSNYKSQLPF